MSPSIKRTNDSEVAPQSKRYKQSAEGRPKQASRAQQAGQAHKETVLPSFADLTNSLPEMDDGNVRHPNQSSWRDLLPPQLERPSRPAQQSNESAHAPPNALPRFAELIASLPEFDGPPAAWLEKQPHETYGKESEPAPARSASARQTAIVFDRQPLRALGFTEAQIDLMSQGKSPVKTLLAVVRTAKGLLEEGFTLEQIVSIATRRMADKTLSTTLRVCPELKEIGYSARQIAEIARNHYISDFLSVLAKHRHTLQNGGFSAEMMISLAVYTAPAKKLTLIVEHVSALQKNGQSAQTIVKQASTNKAAGVFEAWLRQHI